MTFGRWILVHSLSISILVMLGVGYFYKEELKLEQAYSQLLLIDSTTVAAIKDKASKNIESAANMAIKSRPKPSSTDSIIIQEPSTLKPISKEPLATLEQQKFSNIKSPSQLDYLLQARQAYWDKNYQHAIQLYKQQISKTPNSADLYGELGNIYYGLENYDLASSYYLNAGEIFLKMDDQFRAKQIYDILMTIAPNKAQLLLKLKNEPHQ